MCGIFGAFDFGRFGVSAAWGVEDTNRAADILRHMAYRGPDGDGLWQQPGVLLGHRRLSILDLSTAAAQPMATPSGLVLTFNGEIYNYLELRDQLTVDQRVSTGDTEILLLALDQWGLTETLQRIRGMYAFAAWHPVRQELWLARDPVGKKPLYFAHDGEHFVFGSTIESVRSWRQAHGHAVELDPVAIDHVLATGWIPSPRTGIRGLKKLGAGQSLVFSCRSNTYATEKLWHIPTLHRGDSLVAATGQLKDAFKTSIERRLRSDVPLATLLSGGLDSSVVTAAAAKQHPELVAFTVKTAESNQDEFDNAARVARHLGIKQVVLNLDLDDWNSFDDVISRFGEPFCDSSALPTMAVFRQAGEDFKVVLTGDGGDEVQGGYTGARLFALRFLLWPHDRDTRRREMRWRGALAARLDDAEARLQCRYSNNYFKLLRLLGPEQVALQATLNGTEYASHLFADEFSDELSEHGWRTWQSHFYRGLAQTNVLDRHLAFDFSCYLADDLTVKVDVCSMASSVEARSPLLDQDFVERCWKVRAIDRVRPWQRKRIVRMLAREYLPDNLIFRRKRGFGAPVDEILDRPAGRERINRVMHEPSPVLTRVLNWQNVRGLINSCTRAGQYRTPLLWRLLVLDQWARKVSP